MSTAAQVKQAKIILADLEKTKNEGEEDMSKILKALKFNIFAVNKKDFKKTIRDLFRGAVSGKANVKAAEAVYADFHIALLGHEVRAKSALKKNADFQPSAMIYINETIRGLNNNTYSCYLTGMYGTIRKDYKLGTVKKSIKRHYAGLLKEDAIEATASLAGGSDSAFGVQLGHGDIDQAGATMRVERAAGLAGVKEGDKNVSTITGEELDSVAGAVKSYQDAINTVKAEVPNTSECDIFRYLHFDGKDLKCDHIHVLSSQNAKSNNADAIRERNAVEVLKKKMGDVINNPGSITVLEAVESVLFDRAAGKSKGRRKRVTGTRRKSVTTQSKGKAKIKSNDKIEMPIRRSLGLEATIVQHVQKMRREAKGKSHKTPSKAPLHLIGLMNKELPGTVEDNMGAPRLTSQTGRFASSVRLTEMINTPQGYPSIGYTYQRDPYGVFEQDSDYDPRKLIDASIREIAMQFAIGRFYTRRV
tara:strand:- start:8493 stop:9917 length:1425 start_codon:yes stop_codon:yes gene_type:complete